MKAKVVLIGSFKVESGKLYIGDPCYADHQRSDLLKVVGNVLKGEWSATVAKVDFGEWGVRNGLLMCAATGVPKVAVWHRTDGVIWVDSGQVCVFDKKHVVGHPEAEHSKWYDDVGELTLDTPERAGCLQHGFATESGIGDGCYDLKVGHDISGRVVAVRVNFARHYSAGSQVRGW